MSDTAGFLIDNGNINISRENSLSLSPSELLKNHRLDLLANFPSAESNTDRANIGWTI